MNIKGFGGTSQSRKMVGLQETSSPGKIYFPACSVMPAYAHHKGFLSLITDKALNISVGGIRNVLAYICIKNTYQRLSQKMVFCGGRSSGLIKD